MISLALVLQYSSEKRLNRLIVYIYISFQFPTCRRWVLVQCCLPWGIPTVLILLTEFLPQRRPLSTIIWITDRLSMSIFCSLERMVQALSGKLTMHQDTYETWDPRTRIWREVLSSFCPNLKFIILVYVLHFFLNLNYDYWINHKNGNFLNCDWFKKLLFSANLLAKLSDSLSLDNSISQSHSQL